MRIQLLQFITGAPGAVGLFVHTQVILLDFICRKFILCTRRQGCRMFLSTGAVIQSLTTDSVPKLHQLVLLSMVGISNFQADSFDYEYKTSWNAWRTRLVYRVFSS